MYKMKLVSPMDLLIPEVSHMPLNNVLNSDLDISVLITQPREKQVLSPEFRPCILYIFGIAESKSGVR